MEFDPNDEGPESVFEANKGYNAEVVDAEDCIGRDKGTPYINLKLLVYADTGKGYTFYDKVMPSYRTKFKSFCFNSGLSAEYAEGSLQAYQCKGKSTRVRMSAEKNDKGYYEIDTYLPPERQAVQTAPPNNSIKSNDDDIPF